VADKTPKSDTRRFEVTVRSTDGDTNTYKNQTDRQARGFEDLPFTSSNVLTVDVRQTT
jgi:hypothetical protein